MWFIPFECVYTIYNRTIAMCLASMQGSTERESVTSYDTVCQDRRTTNDRVSMADKNTENVPHQRKMKEG